MTIETLTISIRATNLTTIEGKPKEGKSKYKAIALVISNNDNNSEPCLLGQTEIIKHSSDLDWNERFFLNYERSSNPTFVMINIYDVSTERDSLQEIGAGVFEVGSVYGWKGGGTTRNKLRGGGILLVHAERAVGLGVLKLQLRGVSLKNARGFGKKCVPFYQFTRNDDSKSQSRNKTVHRPNKLGKRSINPQWQEETIDLQTFCDGNLSLPMNLSIYHNKSNGNHIFMGRVETSVNELIAVGKSGSGLTITKNSITTGTITVLNASTLGIDNPDEETVVSSSVDTSKDFLISSSAQQETFINQRPTNTTVPQIVTTSALAAIQSAPMLKATPPSSLTTKKLMCGGIIYFCFLVYVLYIIKRCSPWELIR